MVELKLRSFVAEGAPQDKLDNSFMLGTGSCVSHLRRLSCVWLGTQRLRAGLSCFAPLALKEVADLKFGHYMGEECLCHGNAAEKTHRQRRRVGHPKKGLVIFRRRGRGIWR